MDNQAKHKTRISVLPWHREGDKIVDRSGYYITQGSMHGKGRIESMENDMNYIVQAVNCHAELLEACEMVSSELVNGQNVPSLRAMEMINDAITRATGKEGNNG